MKQLLKENGCLIKLPLIIRTKFVSRTYVNNMLWYFPQWINPRIVCLKIWIKPIDVYPDDVINMITMYCRRTFTIKIAQADFIVHSNNNNNNNTRMQPRPRI